MFTLDQIKAAHAKVKSGADFPAYVKDLKSLGILLYTNYVADGHTEYYGAGNHQVLSGAKYAPLPVADIASETQLRRSLRMHQDGHTDYLTFCQEAAAAGVAKWTTHVEKLTCTYYDKAGNVLLTEEIPAA